MSRLRFRLLSGLAAVAAPLLLPTSSRAVLLAYEGWDYSTGTNNAVGLNGGSGWNGAWQGVANNADVVSGSLLPTGNPANLTTTGNSVLLPTGTFHRVGRNLDVADSGVFDTAGFINSSGDIGADGTTLFVSFSLQVAATDSFFEFEFHRDNLGDPGRKAGVGDDASGTNLNLRTPSNGKANSFATRTTAVEFIVVQFDFLSGDDQMSVYYNPTLGTAPGSTSLTLTSTGDLSFDGISLAGANGEAFDEIRFGTTFADVTPSGSAVPEPSTYAALLGALSLLGVVIHRRRQR